MIISSGCNNVSSVSHQLHPEFKALEFFIMDTAYRAYSYHKYSTRWHAMTHYVEEEKDIADIFDLIGYQKGIPHLQNTSFC